MRELDYRVHTAASRLATGNPGNVVFLSPDPTNPFFSLLLDGLLEGLDERLSLSLATPTGGDDYDPQTVRRVQSGDVAALVLASPGDELVKSLRSGRPTVLIDAGVRREGDVGDRCRRRRGRSPARRPSRSTSAIGVSPMSASIVTSSRSASDATGSAAGCGSSAPSIAVPDLAAARMTMDAGYQAAASAIDAWA